jgi:glycosyltransferase involved in cell wall biosynthesis
LAVDWPLVSVIIPVYNGAAYLAEALASVFAQDYPALEVIVVDDGSTDESGAVARSFPAARYHRQPNGGVAQARNAGVAAASGAFLAFLDQDDRWLPGKLRAQVGRMVADPFLGYTLTHGRYEFAPGQARPSWLPATHLADHPAFVPSALVVRAATFAEVGPFDPSYAVGGDGDWLFRAKDAGVRLAVLPDTLLIQRIHARNQSHVTALLRADLLRAARDSIARQREDRAPTGTTPAGTRGVNRMSAAVPTVSVVIPVHNGARYLAEAIASVLAQDHRPLEVLVIDDGSTDESAAVAAAFGPPVRVVHQAQQGAAAARNHGAALAQGVWVAFLDADDCWLPDKLSRQLAAPAADPRVEIVNGGVEHFYSPELNEAARARFHCPPGVRPAQIPSALLVRRDTFEGVGAFDPRFRTGELLDWYGRALDLGIRAVTIPDLVLRRRIHGANHSIVHAAARPDFLLAVRERLARRREGTSAECGYPPPRVMPSAE